ncbi:MAG: tetratricopeptide repeat protein [Planctomycetales bacterium]
MIASKFSRRTATSLAIALVLGLSLSGLQAAEVVTLRSDAKKLSGEVTESSKSGILLKPAKGEAIRIPADDIQQIQWVGEPSALRTARNDEIAGRTQKAFDGYQQALQELGEMQVNPRAEATFGAARSLATLALSDKSKIPAALDKFGEFQQKFPDSYHAWEVLMLQSQMLLLKGDTAGSQKLYQQVRDSGLGSYVLAGELGLARIALSKKEYAQALNSFEQVTASPLKGPLMDRQRQEARLGMAECLYAEKKFADGIKILDELIDQTPAENEKLLATAYLRRGDGYVGLAKTKEAVLSYLHVDVLFPDQAEADAEALYRLSQLWESLQHPERGLQAKERLVQQYPNSSWAKSGAK